jgi:C4-type Zn-finger protein
MTEDLETCPWCREGKLRPPGRAGTMGENEEPFRETSGMYDYVCDNCGYRKPTVKLGEYTD